jgi:hypothetical protein
MRRRSKMTARKRKIGQNQNPIIRVIILKIAREILLHHADAFPAVAAVNDRILYSGQG